MRNFAFFAILGMLGGCAGGGGLDRPQLTPSAASFTYYTPATRLSIAGNLVLLRCNGDTVIATSTLSLVAVGGADRTVPFTLQGSHLSSAMQRRDLAIELNENGTIKSLNATTTDRTGAVVTSILSTAASIIGAVAGVRPASVGAVGAPPPPNPGPCNDATYAALNQAAVIRGVLAGEQRKLLTANPADVEGIRQRIDTLANQLSELLADQLTISVTRQLDVGDGLSPTWQPVRWTFGDLRKWFGHPSETDVANACAPQNPAASALFNLSDGSTDLCKAATSLFAINYSITPSGAAALAERVARSPCRNPGAALAAECGRSIVLPEPVTAVARFQSDSNNIASHPKGAQLGQASVLMPQWGRATYLLLNVRIFQTRSIGFTFGAFGERQSFKWNSEASAENALGAISTGTGSILTGIRNAEGPSDTQRWTEEAAELEARMKINRLRRCEFAIQAGASTCAE